MSRRNPSRRFRTRRAHTVQGSQDVGLFATLRVRPSKFLQRRCSAAAGPDSTCSTAAPTTCSRCARLPRGSACRLRPSTSSATGGSCHTSAGSLIDPRHRLFRTSPTRDPRGTRWTPVTPASTSSLKAAGVDAVGIIGHPDSFDRPDGPQALPAPGASTGVPGAAGRPTRLRLSSPESQAGTPGFSSRRPSCFL